VAGDVLVDLDPGVKNPAFIDGLTDIAATNGTIQAIDRVLLPIDLAEAVTLPTIAEIATGSTEFEALVAALTATGLVDLFTDPDAAFTVFAPTDDAFRGLAEAIGIDTTGVADADLAGALVGALGADLVTDVLLYHVRAGEASVAELQADRVSDTALDGAILAFDGDTIVDADPGVADPAFIDGLTDIEALNGTVQAIDGVLLPADLLDSARVVARGSRDDDVLRGGAGDDRLGGRSGEDVLIGGEGGDRLFGRSGDDLLFGEAGNDILRGGFGDDHLVAGAGNDFLSGGRGADSFDFSDLEGENTIWRFDRKDTLILSAEEFESAEAVLEDATVFARSVLIEGENGSILVQRAFGLDEGDILLV
ncbi:MAG: fasciclin domain-containing protein, partial [Pseudomonadota bacterium]